MQILLESVAKRFGTEYILKEVSISLEKDNCYIILGPNGSGKSTLMKILSGFLSPTKGDVFYKLEDGSAVHPAEIWKRISYAAPYVELIEEMRMSELIGFHQRTRGFLHGLDINSVIAMTELGHVSEREVRYFSSGMKQRLKIALALATQADIVLLDEPTTNLDQQATQWYLELARKFTVGRILVVASNDQTDLALANHRIEISQYK
jgi:ABC-type multidrug transport system ATPase subunit